MELWMLLCDKLTSKELDMMATMMRYMWLRRNELVFEKKFKGPAEMFLQARASLVVFEEVKSDKGGDSRGLNVHGKDTLWRKPCSGFEKVN